MQKGKTEFELSKLEFAETLRNLRVTAGLSNKQMALRLNLSPSTLSKIECGHRLPTERQLHKIVNVLQIADRERERLVGNLRSIVLQHQRHGLPLSLIKGNGQDLVSEWESKTRLSRSLSPNVLQGLLQTNVYAQHVFQCVPWLDTPEAIERAVLVRMQRQTRVFESGHKFRFLITDQALDMSWLDDHLAEAEQLQLLLMRMRLSNVELRVLPKDKLSPFFRPWFTIFDDEAVQLDGLMGVTILEEKPDVEMHIRLYEDLWESALQGDDVKTMIERKLAASPPGNFLELRN